MGLLLPAHVQLCSSPLAGHAHARCPFAAPRRLAGKEQGLREAEGELTSLRDMLVSVCRSMENQVGGHVTVARKACTLEGTSADQRSADGPLG